MPTQNPLKPFPGWRLKKEVKNATDEELEDSSDSCERWGWACGGILLLGLLGEVALAWIHPPYDSFLEQWGSVLSNCLVVLGVGGEIRFSQMGKRRDRELGRRAKERLGQANERAATAQGRAMEAQLELARLQLPRTLNGFPFIQTLAGKPKWPVVELLYVEGSDAALLAGQIGLYLGQAGWECPRGKEISGPNPSFDRPNWDVSLLQTYGAAPQGVTVVAGTLPNPGEPHPFWTLLDALRAGLPDAKFIVPGVEASLGPDELRIVVAHKI